MSAVTYEDVLRDAQRLPLEEQRRLRDQLTVIVDDLRDIAPVRPRRSSYGALAHLGPAPSSEDIDEARREAGANFPPDDI